MITVGSAPTCSKGGGDCNDSSASVFPGAFELCNNVDDNCNSLTDEQASDQCPIDKNAIFKCQAGNCLIQACASGFHDLNGAFTDGCECNGTDQYEPNDTCGEAVLIDSALYDNGKMAFSPEGRVVTTDQDWYRVYASDLGDGGYAVCDSFNLDVRFIKQPGGLALDVYRGSCPAPTGANNQGVCCARPAFNWFTNFKGSSNGTPSKQWSEYGECPCSTGDQFDQSNYGWSYSGLPYCM
ncbi:MAG: hypothetical protein EXR77_10125, partial [Myxococcales bacterium]|nr:hypothetical protein [Myxococcales bacterium]